MDIRIAASHILSDWNKNSLVRIPVVALEEFARDLVECSEDDIVRDYHISYQEAGTIGPALLVYVQLAKALDLVNVIVSHTNLRDGLLIEMAVKEAWNKEFRNQIIRSALDLGRKFNFDEAHARHVAKLCDKLFDQTAERTSTRFQIQVAATYCSDPPRNWHLHQSRGHHKHSMYLIQNSEMFGLKQT